MEESSTYEPIIDAVSKGINPDVPNLNNGGCGRFAYFLHNALKMHNIESTIHLGKFREYYNPTFDGRKPYDHYSSLDKDRIYSGDMDYISTNFDHIVVKIGDRYFNSKDDASRIPEHLFSISHFDIPIQLMEDMLNDNGWYSDDDSYDTNHDHKVKSAIEKSLSTHIFSSSLTN